MGAAQDTIFFYTRSDSFTLNPFYHAHSEEYLSSFFTHDDERGRYKLENLTSPNPRPNLKYPYKGYPPPQKGWRVNLERMEQFDRENRLYFPKKKDGRIMKKIYLHELARRQQLPKKLGRKWIATDLGKFGVHTTRKRLIPTADEEVGDEISLLADYDL